MIELKNVSKTFRTKDNTVEALKNVSITIGDGDIFGIIGMSGAGKSTLVRCINMLERPTEGSVEIDGTDICTLSQKQLRRIRSSVTMVFQGFNLLMQKNCLKNVCFPLELAGVKRTEAKQRAQELLELVGLGDKAKAYPAQLSGGQQQRVAIARALATKPKILLCDEATSALDPTTTNSILELIADINKKLGITVVVITHQMNVVERICKHVAIIDGGSVAEQGEVTQVFAAPQSAAAKQLVFPDGIDGITRSKDDGEHIIRVVFNGAKAAKTPLIALLAQQKNICANISYAATKSIGDKAYGSMILSIQGGNDELEQALGFMNKTEGITAMEVTTDE
jgi:D-methionine transport system ATP-binding protein